MKEIEKVLTLRQAASDIKFGRYFYDEIEQGVGKYFRSSILAEIDSHYTYLPAFTPFVVDFTAY